MIDTGQLPGVRAGVTLGTAIRRIRKALGMGYGRFSKLLGRSEKSLRIWELEGRVPDADTLRRIAQLSQRTEDARISEHTLVWLAHEVRLVKLGVLT